MLLTASTITGLAIGFKYRVLVIGLAAPVIATAAAIALRDFGFVRATAIAFVCLSVSQVAYLAGAWLRVKFDGLIGKRSNDNIGDDC